MGPKLILFQKIGIPEQGFLSIASSNKQVKFEIQRCFWNYGTPEEIIRGRHAHYETEMILIALHGEIEIKTISKNNEHSNFILNDPNTGLYLPKLCWHEMKYSDNAIQLVLCSTFYQEEDYIRDFNQFLSVINK